MLITASELITKSIELYKKNIKLFLTYVLILAVPSLLAMILSGLLYPQLVLQASVSVDQITTFDFLGLTVINLLGGLVSLWFSVSFIKVIANRYKEKKPKKVTEELELATKIIIPALIVSILTSLAIFVGFIMLIIPGIIFSVWFAFAIYEVILDDQRNISALKSSKALVEGRWWSVLWRLFFPAFVFVVVTVILQALFEFFFGLAGVSQRLLIEIINMSLTLLIISPLTTIVTTILYIELKRNPVKNQKPHPDPEKKEAIEG